MQPITPERYAAIRDVAIQIKQVQKVRVGMANQIGAFGRGDHPLTGIPLTICDTAGDELQRYERELYKMLAGAAAGTVVSEWVDSTHGLGPAVYLFLGSIPPIYEFATVGKLWRYCGLDVREGRSPKRARGEMAKFNPFARAVAIARLANTAMKVGGPYREVYDRRKDFTLSTHPAMVDDGCVFCDMARGDTKRERAAKNQTRERTALAKDCANVGGTHWSVGHRHADALRVTAKAIVRDLWRTANHQALVAQSDRARNVLCAA